MEGFGKDVRFALRMLRRTPGVSAAAIVALALGIGANTAIFSVVDGVLLRPLPYPNSSQLVSIRWHYPSLGRPAALSYPEYKDLLAQSRTLANAAVYEQLDANLEGTGSAPERVSAGVASATLFPTLGVAPMLGRNFTAEEERRGSDQVAILTYATWRDRFGADQKVVGRSLTLDGLAYRIVGVLPAGFRFGGVDELWIPLSTSNPQVSERGSHWLRVVGRSKAGVTPAQLDQDLTAISMRTIEGNPRSYRADYRLVEKPLIAQVVGDVQLALWVLLGAVALVLLIACANVANLLLARATARRREMALRTALGARRLRLVRQLLTESLLLAIAGGGLGVLLASWGVDGLLALAPDALPRAHDVALDGRVLAFTLVLTAATGVAFGLIPALSASRPDLQGALRDGARGASAARGRLKRTLVVAELALSLVLLVGTGLMLRSFLALRSVDPGIRPDHVLTLRAALSTPKGEPTTEERLRWVAWFARATDRLAALPGVRSAAAADILPLDGNDSRYTFELPGQAGMAAVDLPHEEVRQVTPGYFETLGVRLVRGRFFAASDDAQAPPVVVVNETLARRYWPNEDPIGKRLKLHHDTTPAWATVVGVAGDVRGFGLDEPAHGELFLPYAQMRDSSGMTVVVRSDGDAKALAASARAAMAELDATQPIYDVQPMSELVASSLAQRKFALVLMLLFAGAALLLTAVGIYGVMSYTVAQRTQEIGIRVALGAQPSSVLRMVIGDGMRLCAIGLGIGLGAALGLTRLLASLLYGVSTSDGLTYAAIAGVLAGVALVAIAIPARRATRVDPMLALRAD
ncbi:MAG TPA: ABC transporter permease [Polyangia bacterium]|nr:ABC transporter permease [Polyangia bacterium]